MKSIRKDPAAGQEGFVVFFPGPGSYTTRMSSIKTNFVPRDAHRQTVLSSISKQEPGFYFTRDKGGLTKHIQPLKLDKTKRQDWQLAATNPGPGKYDPILP